MSLVLSVDALNAGYNGIPAIRDVTLEVSEGEVVALLGPNGAGKTTTLLTIAGLTRPISGRVMLFGDSMRRSARPEVRARRGLGYVTEERTIFSDLSVCDNLRLGAHRRRSGIERALELFPELVPLLGRRAGLLSGGEQQMVSLARALLGQPRLLLVDELSLGLAPIIVERLLPALREIADRTGAGILMVEQLVQLALETADRAYVMSQGSIVFSSTAKNLAARRDLVEASYLGARLRS
jgi:branched-chain amino acid transport system ATP-binding protein